ncbi:hypothetical protein PROFUN_01785 [Planoprotostelium fungivorum]|uniref:Uncharacterized protein n=1 Tax=Planoprotostelium fungivorum TaxID=1890364 RepID=A0A2P6MWH6_9EUKA|nr:hypothetical protein PROFUN_01785 [Planoprotostelium fungivorum]
MDRRWNIPNLPYLQTVKIETVRVLQDFLDRFCRFIGSRPTDQANDLYEEKRLIILSANRRRDLCARETSVVEGWIGGVTFFILTFLRGVLSS